MSDTPPIQSTSAEPPVLGALLRDARLWDEFVAQGMTRDCFAQVKHAEIFDVLAELRGKNETWDDVSILPLLNARDSGCHRSAGLAVYALELYEQAPVAQNMSYYVQALVDMQRRRRVVVELQGITRALMGLGVYDSSEGLLSRLHALKASAMPPSRIAEPRETVLRTVDEFEHVRIAHFDGRRVGVPTGLPSLDEFFGGFRPGGYYVIGARPGMGKTTLGLNFATTAARDYGVDVAFFSVEMLDVQLCAKVAAASGFVQVANIIAGDLDEDGETRFYKALNEFADGTLRFAERCSRTIEEVEAESHALHRAGKLSMIVVDYLQRLRCRSQRFYSKEAEIEEVSGRLKNLALDLKVPVLALAQLNRENTKAADKRPHLAHLKGSGAIEQDCDVALLIHRESYYDDGDDNHIFVEKNRYGRTGGVRVEVDLARSRFYDIKE